MKPIEIIVSFTPLIFIGLTLHFNKKIDTNFDKTNQRLTKLDSAFYSLEKRVKAIMEKIQ